MGRVHRPARGRRLRRHPSARLRLRLAPCTSTKAPSSAAATLLFQIDPRPFQAEVDRLRAELTRARAHRAARRLELDARRASARPRTPSPHEEHERRAAFAQESTAQVAAVEAALRAAELNLEFTRVTSPIAGRVGRALVTEGNLVSSGPGEATLLTTIVSLDPIYAYFDADEQIFLALQRLRGGKPRQRPGRGLSGPDGARRRRGFPQRRRDSTSSTTSSIRAPARSAAARCSRNRDGELTPGLFVAAAAGRRRPLPRRAHPGPRGRHRPRQEVRATSSTPTRRSSTAR